MSITNKVKARCHRSFHLFSLALRIASRSRQRDAPVPLADLSHAKKRQNRGDRVTASLKKRTWVSSIERALCCCHNNRLLQAPTASDAKLDEPWYSVFYYMCIRIMVAPT